MSSTSFDARPVQGYSHGRKVPPWDLGPMPAAGGLYSTASDLAKLLTACLRPPGSSIAAGVGTVGPGDARGARPPRGDGPSGLAPRAARRQASPSWHNGMTGGYSSMIGPGHRAPVSRRRCSPTGEPRPPSPTRCSGSCGSHLRGVQIAKRDRRYSSRPNIARMCEYRRIDLVTYSQAGRAACHDNAGRRAG